jgi:hypothetical protein
MKSFMFFKLMGVSLFALLVTNLPAQVKIGDNPSLVSPSAILELEKANKGLLITRVSLADVWDVTTIPAPANSLLVYNTNFGGEGNNAVSPGFYYWREDQGRWLRLLSGLGGTGAVWIDGNQNILSANSANQNLKGTGNVILGELAFEDWNDTTNNYIAIGHEAGRQDVTDGEADVIAIGKQSAFGNSGRNLNSLGWFTAYNNSGEFVNAIGREAAMNNVGNNVNAFGLDAANQNTGENVNALGLEAAYGNIGPDLNALGFSAANNNQGGSVNAMGDHSAGNNLGSLVNAFGGAAGENNTAWSVNVLGSQSGQFNEGAELNAMGAMSAQYNTISCVNAFGLEAARYNTGYGTNALGFQAAKFNNGDHAIAIGDQALLGDTTILEGEGNIGIGYHAGINVSTGVHNICVGYNTQIPNPSADDQINIGNNIVRESNAMIRLKDFIRLTPLPESPAGAEEGSVYYDNALQKLRVLTASGWQDLN